MAHTDAEFVKGVVDWAGMPRDGRPEVAFIGRSNVGKSSLINALVRRKNLARTSKKPGKTREFNYYLIDRRFYFVDLPGFGFAKVGKEQRAQWAELIERYLNDRMPLRAVVHLIDSRHPPMERDEDVMAFMRGGDLPYLIALTKADKLSNNQQAKSAARTDETLVQMGLEVPVVPTSAQTGQGVQELWQWIQSLVGER
jgi:GTP-binding protein